MADSFIVFFNVTERVAVTGFHLGQAIVNLSKISLSCITVGSKSQLASGQGLNGRSVALVCSSFEDNLSWFITTKTSSNKSQDKQFEFLFICFNKWANFSTYWKTNIVVCLQKWVPMVLLCTNGYFLLQIVNF